MDLRCSSHSIVHFQPEQQHVLHDCLVCSIVVGTSLRFDLGNLVIIMHLFHSRWMHARCGEIGSLIYLWRSGRATPSSVDGLDQYAPPVAAVNPFGGFEVTCVVGRRQLLPRSPIRNFGASALLVVLFHTVLLIRFPLL